MVSLGQVLFAGAALLFVVAGSVVGRYGWTTRTRAKRIHEMEATAPGEVTPGPVKLSGTARPAADGGTFETPIFGMEALAVYEQVEQAGFGNGSWSTAFEASFAEPILVADEGTVRVELPDGEDLDVDGGVPWEDPDPEMAGVNDPAAAIERFAAGRMDDPPDLTGDLEQRRYSEEAIEPGEEVFVVGCARAGDDGNHVVDEPTGDGQFVLTTDAESAVLGEAVSQGTAMVVLGVSLVVMGIGLASIAFL